MIAACHHAVGTSRPKLVPVPSVQVGSCGEPGRDGVMGKAPRLDHADRDLDGDGKAEAIVVDRSMCTADGNCFWNVFALPKLEGECARYIGTFEAAVLEPLGSRGDENMIDVRGYFNLHSGKLLLQSYRFARGGYRIVDALLCKRAADDKLDCADR